MRCDAIPRFTRSLAHTRKSQQEARSKKENGSKGSDDDDFARDHVPIPAVTTGRDAPTNPRGCTKREVVTFQIQPSDPIRGERKNRGRAWGNVLPDSPTVRTGKGNAWRCLPDRANVD